MTPWRITAAYIVAGVLVMALLAIPLWYGWRANVGALRTFIPEDMQTLPDVFYRDGADAVASSIAVRWSTTQGGDVVVFAGPDNRVLAGTLLHWPPEVPSTPGTYGLTFKLGGEAAMRAVVSYVSLPGGYRLLIGRQRSGFTSLEQLFGYGILGAAGGVLVLGAALAWFLARRAVAARGGAERYARALEASRDGIWEWDPASDAMFISDRARSLWAVPDGVPIRTGSDLTREGRFHPADRRNIDDHMARIRASDHSAFDIEYRVLKLDGEVRWLRSQGRRCAWAKGRTVVSGSLTDITERKRFEQALRESEQRYQRALLASNAGLWEWDAVNDELYVSARHLELLGFPPDTRFAGREDFMRRAPFHPEDKARWLEKQKELFASGGSYLVMDLRVIGSGEARWVRVNAVCFRDEAGAVLRWTGSVTDVTEAKRAEEALRASEERYSLAMEASEEGHFDVNVDTDEHFTSERLNVLHGFPARTRTAKRTDFVRHIQFYEEDARKYYAGIAAAEAKDGPERYEYEFRIVHPSGEVRWLRTRGKVTRDAEGRARRRTGVVADVTEARVAERALRESQERYALAVAGSDDGVWDIDFVTRTVFVSARARELAGLPPGPENVPFDEYVRMLPLHPDDVERRQRAIEAHLAGEVPAYLGEFRLLQPDGTYRWRRIRGICVRDAQGRPTRMAGSFSDVDARRRAEDALRLSEQRYAVALEVAEEGHWDWNVQTDEIFASAQALRVMGLPRDREYRTRADIVAQTRYHPEDGARIVEEWSATLAGRELEREFEYRIERGGEWRSIRARWKVFRDAAGSASRVIGIISDITERKRAEEALRLSEERYALAMQASGEAHWDWNIATDEFYVSPRYLEMAGLPPDLKYARREDIVSLLPFHPEDKAKYEAAVAAHFAGQTPRVDLVIRLLPRGELRWLHVVGFCTRDKSGKPARWAGAVSDITARKLVEERLRQSEERYALAVEGSNEGIFDWDLASDRVYVSYRAQELFGLPRAELWRPRRDWRHILNFHPEDTARLHDAIKAHIEGGAPTFDEEFRIVLPGGAVRWFRQRGIALRDASGKAYRMVGSIGDATERKRAEAELRQSEARFRSLVELSSDWYWKQDENLRFVSYVPPQVGSRSGIAAAASLGKRRWEFEDVTPLSSSWEEHKAVLAARQPFRNFEYVRLDAQGVPHYTLISGVPTFDADGRFTGYEGVGTNISERRRFEEELRSRQEMLELALQSARAVPWEWRNGADPEVNKWSPELCALFGLQPGGFDGTAKGWWKLCHPDDWPAVTASIAHARATGVIDVEYRVIHPNGRVRWLNQKGRAFMDEAGNPVRSIGFMFDVTERRQVEDELRARQEMLDLAQKSAQAVAFEWRIGADGPYRNRWSPELAAMYGMAPEDFDGSFAQWKSLIHAEDWPAVKRAIKHALETGDVAMEYRVVHPDGSVHWLNSRGRMFFDADSKPTRMVGFMQDVTDRRHAQEEYRRMEQQLRQAQRLEAMGTLAGGIAHDFNNILGAILGYGEMALRDAPKGSRLRRDLDSIVVAGERGRALVDRVLAFSRSGVGERVPVHVEKVVREALDLVATKLPPDVTLHLKLNAGAAAMLGDATQVHQVMMNLATNAIHAMPQGGRLRVQLDAAHIDTPRVAAIGTIAAGDYVVLEVADTGTGIAPEIMERMFDPFFTTKEVGTGTGLGLSLVHGIVTELGGAIDVASTPGAGSTFTVYLPRAGDASDLVEEDKAELPRGDGQRVLVVDDEEVLVRLATRTLEELGYVPVGFTSSGTALAAFRADPKNFDALITDERMPGLSGSALIREVRGIRPGIPIVLMSGYVGAAIARQAREAGADEVLKKPLSASDLAASLARVLADSPVRF